MLIEYLQLLRSPTGGNVENSKYEKTLYINIGVK